MNSLLQLLRFGVVGVANNALLYLLYLALTWMDGSHMLAATISYLIGIYASFHLNARFTFGLKEIRKGVGQRFVSAYLAGYLLNIALLYLFVDHLAFPHELVQAGCIVVLAALLFLAQKFWVFEPNSK